MKFTHLDNNGAVNMVNVIDKSVTRREAKAQAIVTMNPKTLEQIISNSIEKGDIISTAKVAGIMAAKATYQIIPLCHQIMLTSINVDINPCSNDKLYITATAICEYKTGVEMEALTAVSVAALTIYDMCKSIDRGMIINDICLLKKTGGKSGSYTKLP